MTMLDDTTCLATFTRDGTRLGETHARGGDFSGWLRDDEANSILRRLAADNDGADFHGVIEMFLRGDVQTVAFPMNY